MIDLTAGLQLLIEMSVGLVELSAVSGSFSVFIGVMGVVSSFAFLFSSMTCPTVPVAGGMFGDGAFRLRTGFPFHLLLFSFQYLYSC